MQRPTRSHSGLVVKTNIPPIAGPPSPTLSTATTQASGLNITGGPETIITRAHLRTSVQAFEELLRTSTNYRVALSTLSDASAQFASAIETCSRLKGVSDDASVGFQAAAGLHHIIGNHEQVLSDAIRSQFDKPLRQHLQAYRAKIAERSAAYEQSLLEKNRIIRKTEAENMNVGRRKHRDLNSFRAALAVLQQQVAELDRLKADYYREVLAHEEEVWDLVMGKVSLVVRSSLDVYDRISAKSSDPSLEPMLQSIPDPFDAYGPQKNEDQIYSILPVGILNRSDTSSPSPVVTTNELDFGSVSGVKSWMDQAAASREALYPSQPTITPDWASADWSDAESRARRHSLPGPLISTPAPYPSSSASSTRVPFPSLPIPSQTDRPRNESKLRNVLSIIGESRQPSVSDDNSNYDSTERAPSPRGTVREDAEDDVEENATHDYKPDDEYGGHVNGYLDPGSSDDGRGDGGDSGSESGSGVENDDDNADEGRDDQTIHYRTPSISDSFSGADISRVSASDGSLS